MYVCYFIYVCVFADKNHCATEKTRGNTTLIQFVKENQHTHTQTHLQIKIIMSIMYKKCIK